MLKFTILGFPVAVHWMFWLIMALIFGGLDAGSTEGFRIVLIGVSLGFISILAHELGHAWFQRKYGGRPQIMLHGMGGVAISQGGFTRNQSLTITAAGPAVNLVIGSAAYLILKNVSIANPYVLVALSILTWINIVWAIFNLLPVLPMDGGRLLEHYMFGRNPKLRGQIGCGVAIAAALFALSRQQIFAAAMLGYLAFFNWKYAQGQQMPRMF